MKIELNRALAVIRQSKGRFIGIDFNKRSDGKPRKMVCRTGVRQHLRGGQPKNNRANRTLTVWDTVKKEYRSVPIEGITAIRFNGLHAEVI